MDPFSGRPSLSGPHSANYVYAASFTNAWNLTLLFKVPKNGAHRILGEYRGGYGGDFCALDLGAVAGLVEKA